MDSSSLRTFEQLAAEEARIEYSVNQETGGDPRWCWQLAQIYETLAILTDHIARVAQVLPDGSQHYAREKSRVIAETGIRLQHKLAVPAMFCPGQIDVLDEAGIVVEPCDLPPGHVGDCRPGDMRSNIAAGADDVAHVALELAGAIWTAMANGSSFDDADEGHGDHQHAVDTIRKVRSALDVLERRLARPSAYRPRVAS